MPSPFLDHKISFFRRADLNDIHNVRKLPPEINFQYLTQNLETIEHEYKDLNAIMFYKNTNQVVYENLQLFCYQTCFMLQTYYDTYSPNKDKAKDYAALCIKIRSGVFQNPDGDDDKHPLLKKLKADIKELAKTPFSTSKLRDWVGSLNLERLSTRFSMITVKQSLLLARQYHLLDCLEGMLGGQVNIAILDAPLGVYNVLSVALCGVRFFLNFSVMLKHTLIPLGSEAELNWYYRLYGELQKRHNTMGTDAVWGTVNTLSNFAPYFHIAAPITNYLMIGFTVFDVMWSGYALYRVDENYSKKRAEYAGLLSSTETSSEMGCILNMQIALLDSRHEKARSELIFYIAAAIILIGSLSGAFLLAPPVLVPVCFLVSNIAIAMYLSGDKYGVYKEKYKIVEQQEKNPKFDRTSADNNVQAAWNNLCRTLAKNTLAPLFIIGVFTVSLPVAVLMTLAYGAYEAGYLMRLPELVMPQP